jgi:hypothetical protein
VCPRLSLILILGLFYVLPTRLFLMVSYIRSVSSR